MNNKILLFCVLIIVSVALVACASPAPGEEVFIEVTRVVEGTPETIIITAEPEASTVVWWTSPHADIDAMLDEVFVDTFNESHPDIQLDLVRADKHEDVSRIALQGGIGPDVVQMNAPSEVTDLAAAGYLLPLDDYIEEYGWDDILVSWAYEVGFVGDSVYSIPLTYETILLYYNSALFEANGWEPPQTLEDIEFLCNEADKMGKVCIADGPAGKATRNEWWLGWVLNAAAGPDVMYEVLTGVRPWTDPAIAAAVELNRSWIVDNGWFGGGSLENYFALSHDDNWTAVAAGDALMRISGNWDLEKLVSFCPDDCDWTIPPSLNENVPPHFLLSIGETLSISANAAEPDKVAEVFDHLFNDRKRAANIIESANFTQWLVPMDWDVSDFSADADPNLARYIGEFATVTGEGKFGYATWTFMPPETRLYLNEQFEYLLYGDITVDEYLQGMQELFESEEELKITVPKTGISQ